jgi:multiple sugar transport system ATP-binding protein
MAEVALRGISKSYPGGVVALEPTDLEVRDGELLVLVGPSGCGKTTLLRIIAGLEDPTGGAVHIDGADVTRSHPKDRDVAMVFQSYALYPHMTVYDNLAFGLKMRKTPKEKMDLAVRSAAEKLEIGGLLERKPGALSGGQRQRVALGRAIVREPRVFLLDEPLSNLDAVLRTEMRTELVRIHRSLGRTMIYVTHDQTEAMTMGNHIAVMSEGRVLQIGSPSEVYSRPSCAFVARFIGSPPMNIWRAKLTQDGRVQVEGGGPALPLPTALSAPKRDYTAGGLLAGVRPEDLVAGAQRPGGPCFEGVIEMEESTGSDVYLRVSSPPGEFVVRSAARTGRRPGEGVFVEVTPGGLHLFDEESKSRVM